MNRKTERENAFCLIFEKSVRNDQAEEILADAEEIRDFETTDYIRNTFFGVFSNVLKIDEIISANLAKWDISRISKPALAVLRLAVYEMNFDESIPESVAVNEAVELAKTYCDEKEAGFVNGVLGNISRSGAKK